MRKGHLDVTELEKYKKDDLKALARDLGVSDEGTVKELAARCAAVEVDIPDEDEEPQGTQEPEKEPEQEPQQEPEKEPEQEPQQEPDEEPKQPQPDGMVMVEVVQTYKDLELNRIVRKEERLPMKAERAAVIIGKKLGKAVEE